MASGTRGRASRPRTTPPRPAGSRRPRFAGASRLDARLAFYRLLEARALVEVARATETDARSLLDLVSRRASLGETREVDRIKARVEWLKQQRELRVAEREADAAESALRTLAASPLPQPLVLGGELPRQADATNVLEEATPARLERAPGVLRARAEAARAASLLSSARRSRVPDLGFSVFRQKELDRDAFGASLGIVLPLWNARRGDVARAGAESTFRAAEAGRIRLALVTEVETRRRDVDTSAAQAAILMNELLPSAAESLRLARLLFEEGETSLLDLLDAQRTAREARREEIRARFELAVALAELQRLLGPETLTGRRLEMNARTLHRLSAAILCLALAARRLLEARRRDGAVPASPRRRDVEASREPEVPHQVRLTAAAIAEAGIATWKVQLVDLAHLLVLNGSVGYDENRLLQVGRERARAAWRRSPWTSAPA